MKIRSIMELDSTRSCLHRGINKSVTNNSGNESVERCKKTN